MDTLAPRTTTSLTTLSSDLILCIVSFLDIFSLREFEKAYPDLKDLPTNKIYQNALLRYESAHPASLKSLRALVCYGCNTFNYLWAFPESDGRNMEVGDDKAVERRCIRCCGGDGTLKDGSDLALMSAET
jgi:hypothetical protein